MTVAAARAFQTADGAVSNPREYCRDTGNRSLCSDVLASRASDDSARKSRTRFVSSRGRRETRLFCKRGDVFLLCAAPADSLF